MAQGRRCFAVVLVALLAMTALAAEPPDAPSTIAGETSPLMKVTELRAATPRTFDLAEGIAPDLAKGITPTAALIVSTEAPKAKKRVFDKKFALLAGLAAGLTVADFELTQHCLHRRTCVEADPFMPTNHAAMYATNLPLNAALFWWSYRRKEDGKRLWWVAPLTIIGSHAAGVATNVRFVGK